MPDAPGRSVLSPLTPDGRRPGRRRHVSSAETRLPRRHRAARGRAVHGHGPHPARRQRARASSTQAALRRRPGRTIPDDIAALYAATVPDGAIPAGGDGRAAARAARGEARRPPTTRTTSPSYLQPAVPAAARRRRLFTYDTDVQDLIGGRVQGHLDRRVLRAATSAGSASTTPRRWRSSCARRGSRRGSSRATCPASGRRRAEETITRRLAPPVGRGLLPGLRLGRCSTRPAACPVQQPLPAGAGRASSRRRCPSAAFAIADASATPRDPEPDDIGRGAETPGPPSARSSRSPSCSPSIVGGARVRRLAARPARRDDRRPRLSARSPGSPSRFGFGPRPNQTVYEYAGSLGEVLPDRPAGARDRGPGQGRDRLRPRPARATIGSRPCARPSAACGSTSCASPSADASAAAAASSTRVAASGRGSERAGRLARLPLGEGGRVVARREVLGQVVGAQDRPAGRGARRRVIPHRSNDHIQNRSSGRSNSVSRATLKTPSWATRTLHGPLGRRTAVAGDRVGRASPGGPARRGRRESRRAPARTRAATSASDSPPGAQPRSGRRAPGVELGAVARPDLVAVEALPVALADLERSRRPGAAGPPTPAASHRRRDRVGRLGGPRQRGVDDLARRPGRDRQGRRSRPGRPAARRRAPPARGPRAVSGGRPGPGSGPRRCTRLSPWRTRTSVASRPVRDRRRRSALAAQADRPQRR